MNQAPVVVDASVWVAAADRSDALCDSARRFLSLLVELEQPIALPELARVEVACALARRMSHAEEAVALAKGIQ